MATLLQITLSCNETRRNAVIATEKVNEPEEFITFHSKGLQPYFQGYGFEPESGRAGFDFSGLASA